MADQPILKPKRINDYDRAIFLISIGFIALSVFLFKVASRDIYLESFPVFLGSCTMFIALLLIALLFWISDLEIYSDRIIVKSVFGFTKRIIFFSEISGWSEVEIFSDSPLGMELRIYTSDKQLTISGSTYAGYQQIKALVARGEHRIILNPFAASNTWANRIGIFMLLFGISFLIYAYLNFDEREKGFNQNEIITLNDVVTNSPFVDKRRGSYWVVLKLKKYPEFNFLVDDKRIAINNMYNLVDHVGKGDRVSVDILTDSYLKKLTGQKELEFWDKHSTFRGIEVYGLRTNNEVYSNLEYCNAQRVGKLKSFVLSDLFLGFFSVIFGLIFFISARLAMSQASKLPGNK